MSVKQYFNDSRVNSTQSGYWDRPRLRNVLEEAMNYPLILLTAGSGYGKTRAVYSFLCEYEASATWLQISELDNSPTRFWESFASMISISWPETGSRLREIGFPETDEEYTQYLETMRRLVSQPGKHIRVYDDFHLLHNPDVLRFFEHALSMCPLNVTIILISRTTPDFNLIGMMMHEQIFTIHEDMLRFTEAEITGYFNYLKLPVTNGDIRNIYDDTQGWAFAVNLIGRSLIKGQSYQPYMREALKTNIYHLIEAEISQTVSEDLWRFLLRISLIDHLAASLIRELANDDALIRGVEQINAFIHYDFRMDVYIIHYLFLDYLRKKQQILTDEEKCGTYQKAAVWCEVNGFHMDALSYYEKSGDYDSVMRKIALCNVDIPQDMARYASEILDHMPEGTKSLNPVFPAMYLKLKISLGQLDDASAFAERFAAVYEARPESPGRNRGLAGIYGAWALLRRNMCTYTDIYDFDAYYQRMSEYFHRSPFKTLGAYNSLPSTAWASLVGTSRAGAQEEYIGAVARAAPYVSQVLNGLFAGYEDLLRGELGFYRGEFKDSEQFLNQSIDKAYACGQYSTQSRALVYLLELSFFHGGFVSASEVLSKMEGLLNKKNYNP